MDPSQPSPAETTPPPPPPPGHAGSPPVVQGDSTGGVIPYKNPMALTSYYLGIFSLIPCLGPFLAVPSIILAIIGIKRYKQTPAIKGVVHAWVGIVFSAICLAYHLFIFVMIYLSV